MFVGRTPEEQKAYDERAQALAEQVAFLLTELHTMEPVTVSPGHITTAAGVIGYRGAIWAIRPLR